MGRNSFFKRSLAVSLAISLTLGTYGCGNSPALTNHDNSAQEINVENSETELTADSETENVEDVSNDTEPEVDPLTKQQTNSISMLNYLTVTAEKIHQSSNSKLFLEDVSHSLLNDLYPNAIDKTTQTHISNLLRNVNSLRMITVKRDRLTYIYEQNKAKAMKDAMPSPLSVLNVVKSQNPLQALATVTYLAVDSYTSYQSANAAVELSYLKDGWELDDAGDETISENRIEAFNYMNNIIRDNSLDGDLALNEDAVNNLVKWQNTDNVSRRIQYLESNEAVYAAYGGYWLLLAQSYYDNGDYDKCIVTVDTYLETQPRIFRRDTELATVLPYVIASLAEVYDGQELVDKEKTYTAMLDENTNSDDWALKYYAAVSYVDLYYKTQDTSYLQSAYDIAKNNVNELIDDQQIQNKTYLSDVKTEDVPKDATKEQKKEIEQYNKMLKTVRKTELPPVDIALITNMQLLFSVAEKLNISESEKKKVESIIHGSNGELFLIAPIEAELSFGTKDSVKPEGKIDGNTLSVPASYVSKEAKILVTYTHDGKDTKYEDWTIKEVNRGKSKKVDEFTVSYQSDSFKKVSLKSGDKVTVQIYPYGEDFNPVELNFKVKSKKIALYTSYELEIVK